MTQRPANPDQRDELAELVETLHRTFARIRELTGETADTVIHPASGTSYTLPGAQDELRQLQQIERHHARERAAILDALPARVALLDPTGIILAINDGWRSHAADRGWSDPDRVLGQHYNATCDGTLGPDDDSRPAVEAGIAQVLQGNDVQFRREYACTRGETTHHSLLVASPLSPSSRSGAVVMNIDITERVEAQTRAQEFKQRLEQLIDQASVGILVHHDFRPILANQECARLFGLSDPGDITALNHCQSLFADSSVENLKECLEALQVTRGPVEPRRLKVSRRDGAKSVLECRAFVIDWGDQQATCAMLTDMTRQLETEEQLRQSQRLDAIGQLTGGVAHDFNNLLTVVIGNAELIAEALTDDSPLKGLAEMTLRAAERGATLTNRLLTFSRRQALEPRPTDINRQIAGMESLLNQSLGGHIEIEIKPATNLRLAMIDAAQLENALLNLCLNARDAMTKGGRLEIRTANHEQQANDPAGQPHLTPGRYITVTVTDTGTGMDEATIQRAFEPFFTTKGSDKGNGLGLSMVYGFVLQSRGQIRIESTPNLGTSVTLYLPAAGEQELEGQNPAPSGQTPGGPEVILLVEDNELVREHVSTQVKRLGYRVITASNGRDALRLLAQHPEIDLLFTDIVMPGGISGDQLAEKARQTRPELPVLLTSGYTDNAKLLADSLQPGMHMLPKPYRRQEMAAKLRQALKTTNADG